jgi:hypothetical protein
MVCVTSVSFAILVNGVGSYFSTHIMVFARMFFFPLPLPDGSGWIEKSYLRCSIVS